MEHSSDSAAFQLQCYNEFKTMRENQYWIWGDIALVQLTDWSYDFYHELDVCLQVTKHTALFCTHSNILKSIFVLSECLHMYVTKHCFRGKSKVNKM